MAKYDQDNNPYTWMPGFLRRFLNLTYEETAGSESRSPSSVSTPSFTSTSSSAARSTWSPPSEPTFKASNMDGYAPPSGGFTPPSGGLTPPPPPAPRPMPNPSSTGPGVVGPSGQIDGIQPVTYLVRAWTQGMLPPQGIEAFSKELRATSTDVWNLYTHWARFQTEDIFRFGGEILRTVSNMLPTSSNHSAGPARRITVTVANGNGNGHSTTATATPITPAVAPPAPTATATPTTPVVAPPAPPALSATATPPAPAVAPPAPSALSATARTPAPAVAPPAPPASVAKTTDAAKPGEAKAPDASTKGPKDAPPSSGKAKK